MKIKNCPKCSGPATIRRDRHREKINNVWIECGHCGYRSGSMLEAQGAGDNSSGVKFAVILWNSDRAREGPEHRED